MRRFGCLAGVLFVLAAIAPTLPAQSPSLDQALPPNRNPQPTASAATFTLNARLVVLDVVVRDSMGHLVNTLTANDFEVQEDGQPQCIRFFEPPAQQMLPKSVAGAGRSAFFDPAQPASFGHSPVVVLVLDQLNTHLADSSFARRSLRQYLSSRPPQLQQPTALFTVYDEGFRPLQGFTRDRDALLRALAAPVKYPWKLEINGKAEHGPLERLDQSLRALEEIAQSTVRIPGRKDLVWVGGGFPTINPTTLDGEDALQVKNALRHVTEVLLAAHVTVNAIDPSSAAASMTEITDSSQMDFLQGAGDGLSDNFDPFGASDDFDRLGPITGGRVLRGKNDIASQIGEAVDVAAHSYTLGYAPGLPESTTKFHRIRVICHRPGTSATTRSGYYSAEAVQETSPEVADYDLTTAAEAAIPLNGVPVKVEAVAPTGTFRVEAGVASLSWAGQEDGSSTTSVYILAIPFDRRGRMLGRTLHGMTASARAGVNLNDPSKMAGFLFPVQPSPRAVTIRFVVRDNASGRMGSFDLPLQVR